MNRRIDRWLCRIVSLAIVAIVPHMVIAENVFDKDRSRSPNDAYTSIYETARADDVLIKNATVLDGVGNLHEGTDVLISDGKIAAIGPRLREIGDAEILDASGRWVTPGIIDVHSHNGTFALPLTDDSLSDISEVSSPNAAGTWIEHAVNVQDPSFRRALEGGVTALQILPGSVPLFGGRSVVVKPVPARTVYGMKFPDAPYGLKMTCGENPKGNFGERGVAPTSRQGEVALIREAWIGARAYLEKSKGEDEKGNGPAERDLALETLAGVLEGRIRVHLHCYRADDIAVMLAVAQEFDYQIAAVHHAVEAYKIPDLLRDADVCAAVWSDWWGFKREAFDGIRENAAIVEAAGGCVLMHSDSPFIGQRLNIEAAKAMAAGRRAGLKIEPEIAIRWITANPARVLGLADRIGRIAEGYNADIVVWSGDPFSIYSKADQVYIDGVLRFDRSDCQGRRVSDAEIGRTAAARCP